MYFRFFFICIVFLIQGTSVFAAGSCKIEYEAIPELAAYSREVEAVISRLRQIPPSCGTGKRGIISSSKQVTDVFDRIQVEFPQTNDIILDFEFNIRMAFNGESRSAVMRDGAEFQAIDRRLESVLKVLANNCNLTDINVDIIRQRFELNHSLENLYKNTTLGYPANMPGDIPDTYQDLARAIQSNYNPAATQACANKYSWEKMSEDIMTRIGDIWKGIEDGGKEWRYAIDLIEGGKGLSAKEYRNLKEQLLRRELGNQGLTAEAIASIMKTFNCVEDAMAGSEKVAPLQFVEAKMKCEIVEGLGVNQLMANWKSIILGPTGAKTTTSYVNRNNLYQQEKASNTDISKQYNELMSIFSEDAKVNDEIMTKVINLHITLVSLNENIEKRIPAMIANCRKSLPDIPCDF